MNREAKNPIITIKDVKPSFDNMKVEGVFNAGATIYNGETILLLRVAESVISENESILNIPLLDSNNSIVIKEIKKTDDRYDFYDSRVLYFKGTNNTAYLTSISHLRLARSIDGINFVVDEKPTIFPKDKMEAWGIEDPRITKIDEDYYINYTAVSKYGAATALIKTRDFETFERLGIIFPPENKDVCIFPEKINGKYVAYHRPVPKAFGNPDIWTAVSDNLRYWGEHTHFLGVSENDNWDNGRIGGGAPSFKTDKGWVHIYHASDKNHRYCLGAFLTPLDNPNKIIARTKNPLLAPEEEYEVNGFFGNVVFTCGVTINNDNVNIYYGAADDKVCLFKCTIQEIMELMDEVN